ncbi:hypothetical protein A1F94_002769 [Pyrenophora tritici-repentis]|uniref:Uncharacterized protein n=1 Tax=Pyrenophora tritici-repentis TaxID=45151 RepID=A0A2W1FBK1_9PLEO|nr:hypothetical protein PtrV1_03977 [Pyrenophora tritici-repentis]KAF7451662.1 hypothetical protein A1F99_034390 [Pyrenophora tritici-repentis]KAF7575226.1 hypothetical protein PtrM4_068500 [Pyrenophora tritici-repentis]KAG9386019.1 hypothetical protein A1F94_002769 [Pyrenophora tritici-repentis]KAI0582540.1 hypothetical protein Alg215_04051 [Pyrenophora tritici-repentis]
MKYFILQPARYLVDWNAAWALVSNRGRMPPCVGIATASGERPPANKNVLDFVSRCESAISATRQTRNSQSVQAIELTITHRNGGTYENQVEGTTSAFSSLDRALSRSASHYTRPTVIRNSQLPPESSYVESDSYNSGLMWYYYHYNVIPEGQSTQTSSELGVFVKKLDEQSFEKHEQSLEWY